MKEWQTKFPKGSDEWNFFQEMYGTLQAFWNIENVTKDEWEDYWKCLKEQIEILRSKYHNTPLVKNFTDAILYTVTEKSVGKEHECKFVLDLKFIESGDSK